MQERMITELPNLYAYCPRSVFDPDTDLPITAERLARALPPSLVRMELSREPTFTIPDELLDIYGRYRPTSLFRAAAFEEALGTDSAIFVKDEGATPTGNHKANSAYWIAHLCREDGVRKIVTETTGNWGLALALAASELGLESVCFIDAMSHEARPDRQRQMLEAGAQVVVVDLQRSGCDPLMLSANAAIEYTLELRDAVYIFGSVYNYFIAPQTIIGAEAAQQLGGTQPTIVVGSCGGGANLLGTAGVFIVDRIRTGRGARVFSAESVHCPILSRGHQGHFSIDDHGHYPRIDTYGLDHLLGDEYIGGLGSTIVASPAAHFHAEGLIEARAFTSAEASAAARLFAESEDHQVALETAYQLAAVVYLVRTLNEEVILLNVSSRGRNSKYA